MSNATSSLTIRVGTAGLPTVRSEFINIGKAVASSGNTFRAFGNAASLAGGQLASGFVNPMFAAVGVVKDLRQAAAMAGVGFGSMSMGIAAITATVLTGVTAMKAYNAQWNAVRSQQALMKQESGIGLRYGELILNAQAQGKISDARADELFDKLVSTDPNKIREVSKALRELFLPRDRTEAMGKLLKEQEDMRIAALDGYAKEEAEAIHAKTERFKAIDDELAKFKSFTELRSAMIDAGRANEIKGMTSIAEFRKRLQDQADGEFQTRVAKADAAEKERLESEREKRNQTHLEQYREHQRMLEEDADLVRRHQREQERDDEEFLRRMDERRQKNIQRVSANPFITDAEKYRQLEVMGVPQEELGVDPNSLPQNMLAAWVQMQNTIGTIQQQIAQSWVSVMNAAINSTTQSIMGLIDGTMTWQDALRNVGRTIITEVIQSIVRMGVQWVATQLISTIAGKAIAAAGTAALIPIAAAQTAIWTTPAALATIASYGGAAAASPFQVAGAVAATKAITETFGAFGGMRERGGPVTAGMPYIVGEKRAELFVPDQSGYIMPSVPDGYYQGVGSSPNVNVAAAPVNVVVVNDQSQYKRFLESRAGERIIVKHIGGNRGELGLQT